MSKPNAFVYYFLFFSLIILNACIKKDVPAPVDLVKVPGSSESMDDLQVKPSFTFNTGRDIDLYFTTLDNTDHPVPGIRINLYKDYPEKGGEKIMSFMTGSDGTYSGVMRMAADLDSLVIETPAIGFVNLQKRKISSSVFHCVLGGSHPEQHGKGSFPQWETPLISVTGREMATAPIKALGAFNASGVPAYLSMPNETVDASLITDINTALPELRPVPSYHPAYLNASNQTNLEIQMPSNVWVTFLHEGAGYKNVLCYYKYNINQPPASASNIDTLYAIFPNVSYVNSGGGLVTGNRVHLGVFQPGTVIGFALIANGYNGSAITTGAGVFYSNHAFNPETNVNLKQHCILLNDVNRNKLILSFEDLNRQGSCDNDFNDAIFSVTADPIQGVNPARISLPDYANTDVDGDGVADNFDDYPNDASMAFNNYFPSQHTFGTLAFEDLWPSKGDYDFNDMVVDYNFNPITNSNNKVTTLNASIRLKAIGASYHNGFGIQLPINPSLIESIQGTDVRSAAILRNANGTEAGQSKATIIVFDDAYNILRWPGGGTGVNTVAGAPYVQPVTLNLTIRFTSPVDATVLGLPPYNSFIFINKDRSREVHLLHRPPTDLANLSFLGTAHDRSNTAQGRYYVTANNLPFAIDVYGSFTHVTEKTQITQGYLKFYQWANSGGTQFLDWYKPLQGYQNNGKIFTH